MLLNEITDQQIGNAFIDKDPAARRQQSSMPQAALARQKGLEFAKDRQSSDPLKKRIAMLRQQLAALIIQSEKKDELEAKKNQTAQPTQPPQGQPGVQ